MTDPTYTDLAVAIGRLEEGQKNVLNGIERIESGVTEALDRVGKVEQRQALTDQRVDGIIIDQQAAAARKPPWTAIAALLVAAAVAVKQFLGL